MAETAMNVGYRTLDVTDHVQGARVPVHVLYPTRAPARTEAFGPYAMEVAPDAPVAGERPPLVAISHGNSATPWTHRGLAAHLARAGFVIAMVEHPGNSRADNSLAGTPANLANRPRHVHLALEAAYSDTVIGAHLMPSRAAVIGHSMGGYTALATAGGRPVALPSETADGRAQPVSVERDRRVSALVLLAPALPWFMGPGALADVEAPLLVRTAEHDEVTPPAYVESILGGLPAGAQMDYGVVRGAGHFSFLTPFPPALARPGFPPSQDPPGFDRAVYEKQLCAEVLSFLRTRFDRGCP
jgi:predicted dienelactone hydrolase